MATKEPKFYSQVGQDQHIIKKIFPGKTGGFFIELGACDGKSISNTYALEKYFGWTGLCIEPNDSYWKKLGKNRKCHISHDCVYSDVREVEFTKHGVLSGVTSHIDLHTYVKNEGSVQVKKTTNTLTTLLDAVNAPNVIEYLSLDTEGTEFEILKGLDLEKYKILYMTIEHNFAVEKRKAVREHLEARGYVYYRENKYDEDFIHKDHLALIQK